MVKRVSTPFEQFLSLYQKIPVEVYGNLSSTPPLVTVCVQTYQHKSYIRKCLDQIIGQITSFSVEIQIGEDNSDDGTREICKEYADKYPGRIVVFLHHNKNKFPVEGRFVGRFNYVHNLYSARGKYIACCDGDDYWIDPLKLQKQVDFLENNSDYVVCGHDAIVVDENDVIISEHKLKPKSRQDLSMHDLMIGKANIPALSMVFRNIFNNTSYEIPNEICVAINADYILACILGYFGEGGYKFLTTVEPAGYRLHADGIWSTKTNLHKMEMKINTQFQLYRFYRRMGSYTCAVALQKAIILQMISGNMKYRKPTGKAVEFKLKMSYYVSRLGVLFSELSSKQ